MWTIETIAERNPHLTAEDVAERAKLSPEMLARIAAERRHQEEPNAFFAPDDMTDEELALQFVAEDAAKERLAMDRAAADAEESRRRADNDPVFYFVNYTNEFGRFSIKMQTRSHAEEMVKTLKSNTAWGDVSNVEITPCFSTRSDR